MARSVRRKPRSSEGSPSNRIAATYGGNAMSRSNGSTEPSWSTASPGRTSASAAPVRPSMPRSANSPVTTSWSRGPKAWMNDPSYVRYAMSTASRTPLRRSHVSSMNTIS